jgi:aminopeptidase N
LELSDLIAAFEQETRQNVAEFVRGWMKRPGVPDDFRTRYEDAAAAGANPSKESRR